MVEQSVQPSSLVLSVGWVAAAVNHRRQRNAPPCQSAEGLSIRRSGGRTWWAHFKLTRINIELTILTKKIEDVR